MQLFRLALLLNVFPLPKLLAMIMAVYFFYVSLSTVIHRMKLKCVFKRQHKVKVD